MSDQNSMQFKTEGQPAFPVANGGDDTPSDSSPVEEEGTEEESTEEETNDTDAASSSEESKEESDADKDGGAGKKDDESGLNNPTVKRWQEREEDWKKRFNDQETRHTNDMKALREEISKGKETPAPSSDAPTEVPAWFGGDEAQWASFQKYNGELMAKAEENIRKTFEKAQDEDQKKVDEATTYLNEQVSSIQDDKTLNPKGVKVDRNKLLKFVLENDLVDSKGRWNYKAGWQMMNAAATSAKPKDKKDLKKLADATTAKGDVEEKSDEATSSKDFDDPAKRPW